MSEAGKGSDKRPCLVSEQELALRWELLLGKVTLNKFYKKLKELKNGNTSVAKKKTG